MKDRTTCSMTKGVLTATTMSLAVLHYNPIIPALPPRAGLQASYSYSFAISLI